MTTRLESAHAALEAGRSDVALDELLAAWRETPNDALAAAIEAVGRRVRPSELPGKSAKARQAAWDDLATERRSTDLTLLLDELVLPSSGRATAVRLDTLAEWPTDPRFVDVAFRFLERPPFDPEVQREFWDALERLLMKSPDPRLLRAIDDPKLRSVLEASFGGAKELVASVRARPSARKEKADEKPAATCEAIIRLCSQSKSPTMRAKETAEDFLAAIYARPDDDEPRLVFADWLQERGDPRGEFIALQIGRPDRPSEEHLAREHALARQHGKSWLGSLARVIALDGLEFERGFPIAGRLMGNHNELRLAENDPTWSTFRKLDVTRAAYQGYPVQPLLRSPSLRALRELENLRHHDVDEIERDGRPLALEVLSANEWTDTFFRMRAFPNVKRLTITGSTPAHNLGRMLLMPAISRLSFFQIGACWENLEQPGQRMASGEWPWTYGGTARFLRDAKGTLVHARFELWNAGHYDIETFDRMLLGFHSRKGALESVELVSKEPLGDTARARVGELSRTTGTAIELR